MFKKYLILRYIHSFIYEYWFALKSIIKKILFFSNCDKFNYETYRDVIERIPYFIEEVYNKKRLHSSLGYMPPEEFESKINYNKIKKNEVRQLV